MLKLKIDIQGKSYGDLEFALDEARRLILAGHTWGKDSNDTGKYAFQVEGDPESLNDSDPNEVFIGNDAPNPYTYQPDPASIFDAGEDE